MQNIFALGSAERGSLTQAASALANGMPQTRQVEEPRKRRWSCVAFEDELEAQASKKLSIACKRHGFGTGYWLELAWTPSDRKPLAYGSDFSCDSIEGVSREKLFGSGFFMNELSSHFAVASDGDLYWILAGPIGFIQDGQVQN